MCCIPFKMYKIYSFDELQNLKTRQLLKELNNTRHWGCSYCWTKEDWRDLSFYQTMIKEVLATREHIPNKKESKLIRRMKIKKGR